MSTFKTTVARREFWLWLYEEVGENEVLEKENKVGGFAPPDSIPIIKLCYQDTVVLV